MFKSSASVELALLRLLEELDEDSFDESALRFFPDDPLPPPLDDDELLLSRFDEVDDDDGFVLPVLGEDEGCLSLFPPNTDSEFITTLSVKLCVVNF